MTIGPLEDLGYRVNEEVADEYRLPLPATMAARVRTRERLVKSTVRAAVCRTLGTEKRKGG
ncbi:MAG: hypothetical protein JW940_08230 [Polyangiaceae bacterium]|nr:hypothetical protein [Polyangiaceae bacterium]